MKFRAPETGALDPGLLADWLELCVLCGEQGEIARSEVEDYLHDFGPLGTPSSLEDQNEYADDSDLAPDASVELLVDGVLRHLESRRYKAANWYPIEINNGVISRRSKWQDMPAHVALLLADLSRFYPSAKLPQLSPFRLLFEQITAASLESMLGPSIVTGTSRRPDEELDDNAPANQVEQVNADRVPRVMSMIKSAAIFFGLSTKATDDEVRSSDKDLGLDVLSRVNLGDQRAAGSLYMLTQCATSLEWHKTKRGEPSLKLWAGFIGWDGMQMRAIAVPYHVENESNLRRHSLRCEAVILDRNRLLMSNPDRSLKKTARDELQAWCQDQIAKVPEHHIE